MLKSIKNTAKNALIYSIGNLSMKLIGLVLLPIYTEHFKSVATYGMLSILEISTQILIAVFGLALYKAFGRWYYDPAYLTRQKSVFFSSYIFVVGLAALMIIGFYPFANGLSLLLLDATDYGYVVQLMIFSAGIQIVNSMTMTLMRMQERSVLYSILIMINMLVSLGLIIFFIVYQDKGIEGVFEGQLIGHGVFFVLTIFYVLKNIKIKFEFGVVKEMLSFSLPLVFSSISGTLLNYTDQYTLKYLGSFSDVGIYALGYKISNTIKIFFVSSVEFALTPIIYQMMDKENRKRFYSKVMTYYGFVVMILILLVSFFSKELIIFLARDTSYWEAYNIIPILSAGIFFGVLKNTALTGLNLAKKTKIMSVIIVSMSVFNLVLNLILIPYFGFYGASMATLVSQAFYFIWIYNVAQRHYPIPYEMRKIGLIFLVGMILVVLAVFSNDWPLLFRIPFKLVLIILFPIILYQFQFYEPVEIERIRSLWKKWKVLKNLKENIKNLI